MYNFRSIFNTNYSYILICYLFIFIILLYLLIKNKKIFFKYFSRINIICAITTLFIVLLIKLLLNLTIIRSYKTLIEVISDNICINLIYLSILNIILWFISIIINKIKTVKK